MNDTKRETEVRLFVDEECNGRNYDAVPNRERA